VNAHGSFAVIIAAAIDRFVENAAHNVEIFVERGDRFFVRRRGRDDEWTVLGFATAEHTAHRHGRIARAAPGDCDRIIIAIIVVVDLDFRMRNVSGRIYYGRRRSAVETAIGSAWRLLRADRQRAKRGGERQAREVNQVSFHNELGQDKLVHLDSGL